MSSGPCLCVCIFLCHVFLTLSVSILRCGHVNLPLPRASEEEQRCSSLLPVPALARCHSEEPGGDIRGRGGEALTAATCHISQLKFGGNQFGTLICPTTPTPGEAEEPRPPSAPPPSPHTHALTPSLQKMMSRIPGDTSHQS